MASHIYGTVSTFDESNLNYENDDCEISNDATSNWYADDLFDQLACLQKLPTQSVKSYLDEATSLLYALESAGGSLNESEFTNFLVEGLDDTLFKRVHVYYYLMTPSLNDLSTLIFGHEKLLQQFTSIPSIGTHPEELSSIVDIDIHNTLDVFRVLENTDIGITPSPIRSSSLLTDNLTLAVPTSCTSLKSELLHSFFHAINGYSHSHLDVFKDSFLVSSQSSLSLKDGRIVSLDKLARFKMLCKEVYGGLAQERQSSFLLQMEHPNKFTYSLCFSTISHVIFSFPLSWKLFVFSILRGVIISLVLQSHDYFLKFKLKLRLPPFRLRGRIREYNYIS